MGVHDSYGKEVIRRASRGLVVTDGPLVEIDYGAGGACRIDGVVDRMLAVEIEARNSKQVRGAIFDLLHHQLAKKLLILIPTYSVMRIEGPRCRSLLLMSCSESDCRVVVLSGTGFAAKYETDVPLVATAIGELGFR